MPLSDWVNLVPSHTYTHVALVRYLFFLIECDGRINELFTFSLCADLLSYL